jgi:ABC-type nickel/cobalt efflux system permease component RcnA
MQIAKCKMQILARQARAILDVMPRPNAGFPKFAICILHFAFCNFLALLCLLLTGSSPAIAHPLLNKFYERTVDVRLSTDAAGQVVVEVNYQLEVNQLIALLDAKILLEQRKEEEPGKLKEYYEAFSRLHAPLFADRIYAILDGKALDFAVEERTTPQFNKKDGTLHCAFVLRASAKPQAAKQHVLTFEEGAYKEEAGRVLLSLHADPVLTVLNKDEPSAELKARSPADLKIGDDEQMRHGSLTFTLPGDAAAAPDSSPPTISQTALPATATESTEEDNQPASSLLDLLFDTSKGFAFLLVLAAVFGAFHALTPGHGKTLVAAYLVGERGTLAHAVLLGVVTTLTHTGVVLLLAGMLLFFPKTSVAGMQIWLGLVGGLLVAAMGFWLLYRRLAGQADHFHVGGGHHHHHDHHHHHHGLADHYHDEHGHAHPLPASNGPVGVWGLIVLGISGGIVPCTDAIVMLIVAIGKGYLDRALPLLLAFSAGLAGVLVAIGMLVVTSKRFAGSHFGESRLFRALPILSAALILCIGLWLCYDALHGGIVPASKRV